MGGVGWTAGGALLVRPDKHIGWRSAILPDDPQEAPAAALRATLHRPAGHAF